MSCVLSALYFMKLVNNSSMMKQTGMCSSASSERAEMKSPTNRKMPSSESSDRGK